LQNGPILFIVDSTGLKICGQGEWHAKKYGKRRRKGWKKLHIGGRLRTKNYEAQMREAAIGCAILNWMLEMGEPLSYAIV
jgi:hypothetical protein